MKIITMLTFIALVTASATPHRLHPLSDEFIHFINSKQTLWRAGRNFHRHTPLKYLKKLTGTIKEDATLEDQFIGKPPRYKNSSLPSHFDARDKWIHCRSLYDIRDQGACGSCWAVSTVSAMTDRICIQSEGRKNIHFSELDLMSCCMNCGSACDGGILRMAWRYSKSKGIVSGGEYNSTEGCRPYTIPPCEHKLVHRIDKPPCGHKKNFDTVCRHECRKCYEKPYLMDRIRISKYYSNTDVNRIMSDIFKYGPVTTSFMVYEDFFSYESGIYRYVTGKKVGYHSVKLLGWGEENGVPYWLAANSWNTDWGNRGFFKIIRGKNHLGIEDIVYSGMFRKIKKYILN